MSSLGGIELRSLGGLLYWPPGDDRRPALEIDRLVLRIHEEALQVLVQQRGFRASIVADAIHLSGELPVVSVGVEVVVQVSATPEGLLRITIADVKVASLFGLPRMLIGGRIEEMFRGKPGVVAASESGADIDVAAALRAKGVNLHRMAPLVAVRQSPGSVELEWGAAGAGEPRAAGAGAVG